MEDEALILGQRDSKHNIQRMRSMQKHFNKLNWSKGMKDDGQVTTMDMPMARHP